MAHPEGVQSQTCAFCLINIAFLSFVVPREVTASNLSPSQIKPQEIEAMFCAFLFFTLLPQLGQLKNTIIYQEKTEALVAENEDVE